MRLALVLLADPVPDSARPPPSIPSPEFFQRRQHRRAFHRAAVIRMQHNRATRQTLGQTGLAQQLRRQLGRFGNMDLMSNNFAAVDVEHHVPIKIQPLHACRQPGDVPCPQTVRFGRAMARRCPCARFLRPSPMMLLLLGFQYPVDARLRRQILAPVSQRRHDLISRPLAPPQIAWAFFLRMISAAASASAFS